LHDAAIEAFRAKKLTEATALIEKAFAATPAEQRTRPLVLNRAIIDLTQRTFVMRAVRELSEYLRQHPQPDEQAQDILGAALNIAADNPRWKHGSVWQAAYTEWARRDEQLTASRPGYHRWGPLWLDDAQFAQMQSDRSAAQRDVDEQAARVDRAQTRVDSLAARERATAANLQAARDQMMQAWQDQRASNEAWSRYQRDKKTYDDWVRTHPNTPTVVTPRSPGTPVVGAGASAQHSAQVIIRDGGDGGGIFPSWVRDRERTAGGEIVTAQHDLGGGEGRSSPSSRRSSVRCGRRGRTTFEMIDPSAIAPPPPAPPDPKAVAELVEMTKRDAPNSPASPFANSGMQKRRTTDPMAAAGAVDGQLFPRRGAPAPAPAAAPATAPAPVDSIAPPGSLQVPFGPRSVDH
jgi:hypothetical protein